MSKKVGVYCQRCMEFTIHKVYDFFGRDWYECTKCAHARDAEHLVDPFDKGDKDG